MSEVETHKGKLIPMVLDGATLEERCESACKELDYSKLGCHRDWLDCLKDEGYKSVYIDERTSLIYRIADTQLDPYGFSEGTLNDDGSVDYIISWYNGGASMDEVLDSVMQKMNKI